MWKQKGIPHKGWTLEDVIDIRENGQDEWETDYETCMMCGKEKIRFVHILSHPEVDNEFRVGCQCAQRMTDDYVNPEQRERKLRNRANRRINWTKKEWKVSKNGNLFLNVNEHHLLIYQDKRTKKYKVKVGETFGKKLFESLAKAKIAAFNGMEFLKDRGDW